MQKMEQRQALLRLKDLLLARAYDPAVQLTGYLQTGDPTYLPPGTARCMAPHLEPDLLLQTVVELFLEGELPPASGGAR